MDNNIIERDTRPFAAARKAWLFANSLPGADASAVIYSLMLTCRACNVEPCAWLRHVLTELLKRKAAVLPRLRSSASSMPSKRRLATANDRYVEKNAEVAGQAKAARVPNALAIANDQVRRGVQLFERQRNRRQLAERKQSRHVRELFHVLRACVRDDLEGVIIEYDDCRHCLMDLLCRRWGV